MASSSKVRRIGKHTGTCAGVGFLPVPDPRVWPEEIRTWFRNTVGQWGPSDVFIFDEGAFACMYLQDAVTAAAVLDISVSEWHTERGFPAFCFESARIGEIQHRLGNIGYQVHVLKPETQTRKDTPDKHRRAEVVEISVGSKGSAKETQ